MDSENKVKRQRMLGSTLHKTHDCISRLRHIELRKYNLTPIRLAVLSVIVESFKPVTMAMIASKIARELHTVTELLMRMQKDGLIKKIRQKRTAALYNIEATEKGKKSRQEAHKIDITGELFSTLSPQEQDALTIYLEKLKSRSLEELRKYINIPLE